MPLSLISEDRARSSRSQRFLRLSLGFWSGKTRAQAWLLTAAILFFLFANLGAALAVNRWNKFFFDALEQKDTRSVILGLGLVLALALFSAAFSVGLLHARMRLQVRWRQWLARTLIARWLADRHFYQLAIVHTEADNPEARIAEDGRIAIELLVDFSLGVLNALLAAVSFIGILWVVGGSLTVAGYSIPGYMVFACIIYSAITTLSMFLLGRPLVRRVEEKAAGEAQLRYELTRVKDNAENIAMIGGDDDERERLDVTFSDLVQRWLARDRLAGANDVAEWREPGAGARCSASARRTEISLRRDDARFADAGCHRVHAGPGRAQLARRQCDASGRLVRLLAPRDAIVRCDRPSGSKPRARRPGRDHQAGREPGQSRASSSAQHRVARRQADDRRRGGPSSRPAKKSS